MSRKKIPHDDSSKTFIVRSLPSPKSKPITFGVLIMESFSISTSALFLFLVNRGHTKIGSSLSSWSSSFPYRFLITFLFLVMMILPLIVLFARRIWRSNVNLTEQNICKVQVTSLGLQITEATLVTNCNQFRAHNYNDINSTPVLSTTSASESQSQSQPESQSDQHWRGLRQKKVKCIPLSDVLDVVISEIVLGYKVITCVMFRIQSKATLTQKHLAHQPNADYISSPSHHKIHDNRILRKRCSSLVPAFSPYQVQMSYAECEQMWVGLMKALGKLQ